MLVIVSNRFLSSLCVRFKENVPLSIISLQVVPFESQFNFQSTMKAFTILALSMIAAASAMPVDLTASEDAVVHRQLRQQNLFNRLFDRKEGDSSAQFDHVGTTDSSSASSVDPEQIGTMIKTLYDHQVIDEAMRDELVYDFSKSDWNQEILSKFQHFYSEYKFILEAPPADDIDTTPEPAMNTTSPPTSLDNSTTHVPFPSSSENATIEEAPSAYTTTTEWNTPSDTPEQVELLEGNELAGVAPPTDLEEAEVAGLEEAEVADLEEAVVADLEEAWNSSNTSVYGPVPTEIQSAIKPGCHAQH